MSDENPIDNPTTLNELRKEARETKAAFLGLFEGDLCDGKYERVSDHVERDLDPFVQGFANEMKGYGIETPEQAAEAVRNNPLLGEQAQFASANMHAIASDAYARRTAEADATFKKICPKAFDRDGKLSAGLSDVAIEYLRHERGWSDEKIADEYVRGELRHPVNQAKAIALSQKWDAKRSELRNLESKYFSGTTGWSNAREAARYRTLKSGK